jgi:hypothetical protein
MANLSSRHHSHIIQIVPSVITKSRSFDSTYLHLTLVISLRIYMNKITMITI